MRTALGLVWQAGRAQAALLVVLSALLGVAPVFAAWMVKVFADRLDGGNLVVPALGVAASTLVLLAVPAVLTYQRAELERRVALLVNDRLFTAINGQPGLRSFEDPVFHNRLQLAQQGGENAPPIVLATGMTLVESGVTLVGFFGSLLVVSPIVALLALAAAVPGLVVERRLARAQADLAFTLSPHDRRRLFYGSLQTDERAAKEIRLFGLGGHFLQRMLGEFRTLNDASRRMDRTVLSRQLMVGVLTALLGAIALLIVAGQAGDGRLGAGDVFVVIAAIAGVQAAAGGMVTTAGHLLEAVLLLGHYRDFMADAHEAEPGGGAVCPPLRDAIELDDVWFRYSPEHPWVLEGVSLRIAAGEAVALVGLNGAGKSTLVKLLCRLYDPERGSITWDGTDVRALDVASLRRRVATVFQDFMEYDLSAAENVALGDVARLDDRVAVERAAAGAGVDRVLAALPRGYDTLLSRIFADGGDAGVELSGGQWQRIAVARMLMRPDPDVLILDEPSAGLDADAEHELHGRLLARREGTTSVLISHRLSAVAMAERIVVLSGGRIIESGTHAALLASGGEYARLFNLQASGYRDA